MEYKIIMWNVDAAMSTKGNRCQGNLLVTFALEPGGKIRYKMEKKITHFYEIWNS